MEGNALVHQVYPVSRITGQGRAKFVRAWGPGFEQEDIYRLRRGLCVEQRSYLLQINLFSLPLYLVTTTY